MKRLGLMLVLCAVSTSHFGIEVASTGLVGHPPVVAAAEARPGAECDELDEGKRQIWMVPGSPKLADDGTFTASLKIVQIECTEIDGGTKEVEDPPGSGKKVIIDLPDEYEWKRKPIDLPVPKGRVRLDRNQNLFATPGVFALYKKSCAGATGLGWRGTYAEPDQAVQPPNPQPHVFKTDLTWRWDGADVVSGGRLICEPHDTSAIQTHVLEQGKNGLLIQFPQNATQYDIAGAVAARVLSYPYQQLARVGMAPGPLAPALTGLRTYYWLDGLNQPPFNGDTVTVGPAGASLRAFVVVWPNEGRWDYGDGGPFSREILARRGVPYPAARLADGSPHPQAISYVYDRDGAFQLRASVDWSGRWALLEDQQPLGGYAPVILSLGDNLPVFPAPTVAAEHARPVTVKQARAFIRDDTPIPSGDGP